MLLAEVVPRFDGEVEDVGRHHLAAHRLRERVDLRAATRAPVALRHGQAALGHLGDGGRVLLRDVDLQPLLDARSRREQLRPVGVGNRVPGLLRDDGRADDRRQADIEHVRRLPVPLEQQRRQRRASAAASIIPVVRPVMMSVIAIARG